MEIDDYFVMHFNHITACVQSFCWGCGLYTLHSLIRYSCTYKLRMSSPLVEAQWYIALNSMMYSTLCNGIIFCFYLGLPHMLFSCAICTLIQPVAVPMYMYFTESREEPGNFNPSTSICNSIWKVLEVYNVPGWTVHTSGSSKNHNCGYKSLQIKNVSDYPLYVYTCTEILSLN